MSNEQAHPVGAPEPGIYRHYKGPTYQVLGMARHSETEEWLVVYKALYGDMGFWLRPLAIWLEPVEAPTQNDSTQSAGKVGENAVSSQLARFELVSLSTQSLNQLSK